MWDLGFASDTVEAFGRRVYAGLILSNMMVPPVP